MKAIRGATTVTADTPNEIRAAVKEMLDAIAAENGISERDILFILFSSTDDIRSFYPAKAAREAGYSQPALYSSAEPPIEGALPLCIRVLAFVETDGDVRHVYLRGAANLRKDLKRFTIALDGPSGSGKSTLLNVISTIDHPASGSVWVDGQDPHNMHDDQLAHFRRSTLGFVFQDFNLVHTLTVGENIMLPLTLEGVPVTEIKQRTAEAAALLGIEHLLSKRTFEISGDQAQRLPVLL